MSDENTIDMLVGIVTELVKDKKRKSKKIFSAKDETPEFQEFWRVWLPYARNNDGRGLARDAFFRHVTERSADPRDIVDGARYYLRSVKEEDKRFVPLSATWINRGAYEDMAATERALQKRITERAQVANVVTIQPKESPERRAEMAARLREVASSMRVTGQ